MSIEHKHLGEVLTFKDTLAEFRRIELSKIRNRLIIDFSRKNLLALIEFLSRSLLDFHTLMPTGHKCDSTFCYVLGGCDTLEVINAIIDGIVEVGSKKE